MRAGMGDTTAIMKQRTRTHLPVPCARYCLNVEQIVSVGAGMDTRGLRLKVAPGTKVRLLRCAVLLA